MGGAALGAIIGGASHAAGPGALIGAGAGLIAGTAIGSDNAHHAAADVQHAYSDAYYACMDEADDRGPPPLRYAPGYAYGAAASRLLRALIPIHYPPYYYGPRVTLRLRLRRRLAGVVPRRLRGTADARQLTLCRRSGRACMVRPFSFQVSRCRPKPIPPSSIRCSCGP